MMNNSKIGLAVVGGYFLGRTKKAKLAIGLGMVLAGKKLNLNPQQILKTLSNSPVVGELSGQVRKELVDGTKSALTSAVTQRANHLADSLHERTLDMNDPERNANGSDADSDDDADRDDDDRAERDDSDEREERPARRKAPAATTAKSARSASTKAASSNGRGGAARKTASSGARKATAGTGKTAAKTASGAARKTTKRGGGNG
ncbi:hypothetical protein [Streptomyces albidus (ex Kaewkla and Franco 2022)]|uniref:hypothetical protein n=1 Tax=Streptomyces albidus (ex Kaewkla and Franco 2022) TaxID=722709 RepID=UPI0015EE5B42|nr:hypothetical protein [Streptomyces albidus (ex Kaewkla and Franco 2022)]